MQTPPNDRPSLTLSMTTNGVLAKWGPDNGPWGTGGIDVHVKEWWLSVGTKVTTKKELDDKKKGKAWDPQKGGFQWEIVNQSVGSNTQMTVPSYLLPAGKTVYAQVIGFFDSKTMDDKPIVEGIYSKVNHVNID